MIQDMEDLDREIEKQDKEVAEFEELQRRAEERELDLMRTTQEELDAMEIARLGFEIRGKSEADAEKAFNIVNGAGLKRAGPYGKELAALIKAQDDIVCEIFEIFETVS